MGALAGIRVLDLSRVLAGPWCTQLLADLGATVIKVERPGEGDDTRAWGPPWFEPPARPGERVASYYLSANRGKRSVAIDMANPEGAALIRAMAAEADIVVENFKVGGLRKYGLDYASLRAVNPRLIYCSITGFGQDGPYAERPGYDFVVQGLGGLMGVTGVPDGEPMRAGVALTDIMTGMYATVGILAALHHRERTGEGQQVDANLLDTQVATMANQALGYLATGRDPKRLGNAHASVVPYQTFAACDGEMTVAAGNDGQFRKLCEVLGVAEMGTDPRYATNAARVANRDTLIPALAARFAIRERAEVLASLQAQGIPCGPINTLSQVFADPQVVARGMAMRLPHPEYGEVPGVRCAVSLSATPTGATLPPPAMGAHTADVLAEVLGLDAAAVARLREAGVVG